MVVVNGTNVLNDTDYLNSSYLTNYQSTSVVFIMQLQNIDGVYFNFSLSDFIPVLSQEVYLFNQSALIVETGQTSNATNLTIYDYLNIELSVQPTNSSINNSEVWYQWFLDGADVIKGWN